MTLLSVNGVSKLFAIESGLARRQTGTVTALDDVSFELAAGETIGIIGESGSGKSTLAKVICRLLEPDRGTVTLDGRALRDYRRGELASRVQMIFQDPFASLNPKLTVGTILGEAVLHLGPRLRREKVIETLGTVGLPGDILSSYPHQFSGGQRQRIAIARALLKSPKLIIADEPLSALDISIQNQLLALFMRLKSELGVSFLFISHDIVTAGILSDRFIVMKDGKIVEEGSARAVIASPQSEYTKRLLSAVPSFGTDATTDKGSDNGYPYTTA